MTYPCYCRLCCPQPKRKCVRCQPDSASPKGAGLGCAGLQRCVIAGCRCCARSGQMLSTELSAAARRSGIGATPSTAWIESGGGPALTSSTTPARRSCSKTPSCSSTTASLLLPAPIYSVFECYICLCCTSPVLAAQSERNDLNTLFCCCPCCRDDVLPCRVYLRHCVLAAKKLSDQSSSEAAYNSFLDDTYLADRVTTVKTYLAQHPDIMYELPPPELAARYSG